MSFFTDLLLQDITVNLFFSSKVSYENSSWSSNNFFKPSFSSIGLVLAGGERVFIDGITFDTKPNHLYLLPENTLQFYNNNEYNNMNKYYCHFNIKSNNVDFFSIINLPLCVECNEIDRAEAIFKEIISIKSKYDILSIFKKKELILSLVQVYISSCGISDLNFKDTEDSAKIYKVVKYIDDNLDRELTLENLSQIAHFHPNYFSRLFKQILSVTPNKYINEKRLSNSASLLAHTSLSIGEISDRLGFCNQFYFSKVFKKKFGLTPKEFREKGTRSAKN